MRNRLSDDGPQFSGSQPEWLTTIYGLGYVGVAHTVQAKFGLNSAPAGLILYAVCLVSAMITGRLVRRLTDRLIRRGAKTERIPRILSAVIALCGMCVAALPQTTGAPVPAHPWTTQWLPAGTGLLLVVVALTGEALVCWFPATEPELPSPVPPERSSWWKPRPIPA